MMNLPILKMGEIGWDIPERSAVCKFKISFQRFSTVNAKDW